MPSNASYDKKTNAYLLIADGKELRWFDNGELYSECEVNSSKLLHGKCRSFGKGTGIVLSSGMFKNGQRNGLWQWNFSDGKPYYIQNFTYGKKRTYWVETVWGNEDGKYERFYDSGNREETGSYDSGYKTAAWSKFFRNGKTEYTGSFLKDKKVKNWVYYYPSGKKEAEELYDSTGTLISRITYHEDGKIMCNRNVTEKKLTCSQ
ncbi:MAG: hypothetical protein K8R21_12545 [Leptospira sp.]|nr:hypothetical protein [Leptospira sp.]